MEWLFGLFHDGSHIFLPSIGVKSGLGPSSFIVYEFPEKVVVCGLWFVVQFLFVEQTQDKKLLLLFSIHDLHNVQNGSNDTHRESEKHHEPCLDLLPKRSLISSPCTTPYLPSISPH